MRLVLASASPRRAELLTAAGFTFEVLAVDLDERAQPGEAPAEYVRRLAAEKSARAFDLLEGPVKGKPLFVLGADTAVVVGGEILGKPTHDGDADRMLRLLSGRAHDVMTGISLRSAAGEVGGIDTTSVWFSRLSPDDIADDVATGAGRGR